MKKVIVLGAGLVGSAIAIDLKKAFDVTSVDINDEALGMLAAHGVKTVNANLKDDNVIQNVIKDFDLVVGAVPGFMGFNTVKQAILAGKSMVDISFFPEDPFLLDALAKEKNVCIVTDCGVAPGMGTLYWAITTGTCR
jgi:saccharopine dehydrogenase-like NADP-dependent oxidoreductase